jgi:hypothetical protein
LRSDDETSKQARTGQRRENGPEYPQSHPARGFDQKQIMETNGNVNSDDYSRDCGWVVFVKTTT